TMSDELFAAATNIPAGLKRLVKIEGASHSGAVRSGKAYESAVTRFITDASQAHASAHHAEPSSQSRMRSLSSSRSGARSATGGSPAENLTGNMAPSESGAHSPSETT